MAINSNEVILTQEKDALYRLIVDGTKDYSMFMLSPSGQVLTWNQGAHCIKGYTADEIINQHFSVFYSVEDNHNNKPAKALDIAVKTGKYSEKGWRLRKDGSPFWADVLITAIFGSTDELLGFTKVTRDLTEQHQIEQSLIESEKQYRDLANRLQERTIELDKRNQELQLAKELAEKAVQQKSNFLSIMSHELRTPLNAVVGFTQLLMEKPRSDQRQLLEPLQFSTQTLLALIDDILDFSKIEAGKILLESTVVDVPALLTNIHQLFLPKAQQKGIDFVLSVPDASEIVVKTDPTRLSQIITNLVSNAIKFTHQGSVRLGLDVLKTTPEQLTIQISVSDTGIGIPESMQQGVFDRFTQADDSTTRQYGGSGLGLAIAKGLLELYSSHLNLQSTSGQGSTFSFLITFDRQRSDGAMPAASQSGDNGILKGMKVLIAEDNPINVLLLKHCLRRWQVVYDWVENGQVALEMLQQNEYDLLLLDLHMPVMDGFQTASAIRQLSNQKIKSIPIIALTASAMIDERTKAHAVGMNDYLTKPFKLEDLQQKLIQYRLIC